MFFLKLIAVQIVSDFYNTNTHIRNLDELLSFDDMSLSQLPGHKYREQIFREETKVIISTSKTFYKALFVCHR